jgi:hypothetical protein
MMKMVKLIFTQTDQGSKLYAPDESGVWMSSMFDGDSFDQISDEWKLGLAFES